MATKRSFRMNKELIDKINGLSSIKSSVFRVRSLVLAF
jgi:hypothetical protein